MSCQCVTDAQFYCNVHRYATATLAGAGLSVRRSNGLLWLFSDWTLVQFEASGKATAELRTRLCVGRGVIGVQCFAHLQIFFCSVCQPLACVSFEDHHKEGSRLGVQAEDSVALGRGPQASAVPLCSCGLLQLVLLGLTAVTVTGLRVASRPGPIVKVGEGLAGRWARR